MADLALLEAAELLYTESASSSPPPHEPWSSSRLEGPLCATLPDLLLDLCRLLLTRETSNSSDSGGNSTVAIFQQHVGVVYIFTMVTHSDLLLHAGIICSTREKTHGMGNTQQ